MLLPALPTVLQPLTISPPSLLAPALLVVLQTAALLVLQPPATPLFKDQWWTATVATGQFGLLQMVSAVKPVWAVKP